MKIPLLTRSVLIDLNKRVVALVFCLACALLALPYSGFLNSISDNTYFGIPSGYFFAVFIAPLACLFLVSLFIRIIEDIDRHDQNLENE